jgi:hypothetical protein
MRLIIVVIALFSAYLAGNRMAHPFIDGDLFWQRQLGEYVLTNHAIPTMLGADVFSSPGAPWTPHEWLLGIFAALVMDHHALWALSVMAGLAVFAALVITAYRAKKAGASTMSTLAALLFSGICLEGPFALRAQVLAWPLLAGLMLALDSEGPAVFWALPLIVAWANLHASVMLAVPIVWVDAAIFIWQRSRADGGWAAAMRDRSVMFRLVLCVAAPLATLCTPLGLRLPIYAFDLLNNPIRQYIQEWQPMTGLTTQIVAGFFPLIGLCLYGAVRVWRKRPRDLVLTFVMAIWTLVAVRNIALFAIVAAVAAALAVDTEAGWDDPLAQRKYAFVPLLALLIGVPLVGYFAFQSHPLGNTWDPPERTVAALAALPGQHDLMCTEFSKCAYALGQPNIRVFLDGRADPFPPSVWQAFVTVSGMFPGWPETLDHYKVNALIIDKNDPIGPALAGMPQWQKVPAQDDCCALFIRRSSKG